MHSNAHARCGNGLFPPFRRVNSGTGAASATAAMPWHIMRNGTYAQYAKGNADEVAVYDRALPASTITQHYQTGRGQ